MSLDRTSMRNDLPFLRRRVKNPQSSVMTPVSQPKLSFERDRGKPKTGITLGTTVTPPNMTNSSTPKTSLNFDRPDRKPAAASTGLSLGGNTASQAPTAISAPTSGKPSINSSTGDSGAKGAGLSLSASSRPKMDVELPKHTVPYFRDSIELSVDANPVFRLDFRQSGVGSITVDGAQAFAWETFKGTGGLQVKGGAGSSTVEPPSFGRRKLVEFDKDTIIIGMRHSQNLRRLVIASSKDDLRLKLHDGSEIFMPVDKGNNVMLISRIGHELEIRMERIKTVDIVKTFSIKMSHVA